jgi:hypothetical protein
MTEKKFTSLIENYIYGDKDKYLILKCQELFSLFREEVERYGKLRHWQIVRKALTIQRMIYIIYDLEVVFHNVLNNAKT